MSTINCTTATEQKQVYTAPETKKQESVGNTSLFNSGENNVVSTVQSQPEQQNAMVTEENYNNFIEELVLEYTKYGANKERILYIFDSIGYTKEKFLTITKEDYFMVNVYLEAIINGIYANNKDPEDAIKCIIALNKYNDNYKNNIKALKEFLCDNSSDSIETLIKFVVAKSSGINDELKSKCKNIVSIQELSSTELKEIITELLKRRKDLNIDQETLVFNLYISIPDEKLADSDFCKDLYNIIKEANKNDKLPQGMYQLIIEKISNSGDKKLQEFLDKDIIDDMFNMLKNAESAEEFLIEVQEIIDNGIVKDKTIFANKIAEYLQEELSKFNEINSKEEKSPEELNFLKKFQDIDKYAAAHGYANICADYSHAKSLNAIETDEKYKKKTFEYTYKNSFSKKLNRNPIKVMQRMDELTNNAYSEYLQKMGYELPTEDNIEALREKAANGELKPSVELAHREADSEGFGYSQAPKDIADISSSNAIALQTYITYNSPEETFKVDGKVDEKIDINPIKPVNIANLGNYSGEELQLFIKKGFVKFSDAIKQYTSKLSESGKQFVVNEIKNKNKGEQAYALNSANNTAKFDIMKKADLFDEGLNVEFDTIHQKLAEKYSA